MRLVLSAAWDDVCYAVRAYGRTPLFTCVVVGTLALGIGSTAAIFSVLDAVVLRPLPYPRPMELVAIGERRRDTGALLPVSPAQLSLSLSLSLSLLSRNEQAFDNVAAYGTPSVDLSGPGGDPEEILAATCSRELFAVLGIAPSIGRAFTIGDTVPGAPRVAVIGHGLWQRRFAGDAASLAAR